MRFLQVGCQNETIHSCVDEPRATLLVIIKLISFFFIPNFRFLGQPFGPLDCGNGKRPLTSPKSVLDTSLMVHHYIVLHTDRMSDYGIFENLYCCYNSIYLQNVPRSNSSSSYRYDECASSHFLS